MATILEEGVCQRLSYIGSFSAYLYQSTWLLEVYSDFDLEKNLLKECMAE